MSNDLGPCGDVTTEDCAVLTAAADECGDESPAMAAAIKALARCVVVLSEEIDTLELRLHDARADLAKLRRAVMNMDDAFEDAYHYPVAVATVVSEAMRCSHTVADADTSSIYRCVRARDHRGEHDYDPIPERVLS